MTEHWPPYNYQEKGEIKGFSVEIIKQIMKTLKITSDIKILPGARGEMLTRIKKNHILFTLFRTTERENLYKWVGPISTEQIYFYKKRDNPVSIQNLDDIRMQNLLIATLHEGMVYRTLKAANLNHFIKAYTVKDALKSVYANKADLIALTGCGIKSLLVELNLPKDTMVQLPIQLFKNDLYIVFSTKTDDTVVQKWQNTLDHIKSTPQYQQLQNLYLK